MAKRFTDTNKWRDLWWQSLSNDYKIIWQYLLDHCDHAGTIGGEFKLMSFMCDCKISPDQFWKTFRGKVIEIENSDRWLIVNFCKNQYPTGMTSDKPAIVSARAILLKFNVLSIIEQSFNNHYTMIKDKDKDTNKDSDEDKDKETGLQKFESAISKSKPTESQTLEYFTELNRPDQAAPFFDYYSSNGWKIGGKTAMKDWQAAARNWIRRANPQAGERKINRSQSVNDVVRIQEEFVQMMEDKKNNP